MRPTPVDMSTDRAWLNAFRAGDRAALERTFRTYAPYVLAILRRGFTTASGGRLHGISSVDAQHDLLQDVFTRVLSPDMRARYDGLRPYATFLRGVVGNVMREDARRRHTTQKRTAEEPPDLDALDPADGWMPGAPLPEAASIQAEEREVVRGYLATLSPEERRFIQVRFEEGASQRDAANELGLGRQTVRTMEARVRDGLRAFVAQWRRPGIPPNPDA